MWKNSLAIIVIGSLFAGSSFANPLNVKKIFMKDQMQSTLVSKTHTEDSPSKFSGIWTGTCTHDGGSDEIKIRLEEDGYELSIIDLIHEGWNETISFNVLESKTRTGKDFYESSISRLTRMNENTLKLEDTGVFATPSNFEKKLVSGVFAAILTVNNNQLTVDTTMKSFNEDTNETIETIDKCILKRTG